MAAIEVPLAIKQILARHADAEKPPLVDVGLHVLHHPFGLELPPGILANGLEQGVYGGRFGKMFLLDLDKQREKFPRILKVTKLVKHKSGLLFDPHRDRNVIDINTRMPAREVVFSEPVVLTGTAADQ
ncbi:MAG: hypothetical protein HYV40_04880 [Candidatus Levybacteria bacterium]|nr:hypothetical protein [Candidatus Levybacteria bacterium]